MVKLLTYEWDLGKMKNKQTQASEKRLLIILSNPVLKYVCLYGKKLSPE